MIRLEYHIKTTSSNSDANEVTAMQTARRSSNYEFDFPTERKKGKKAMRYMLKLAKLILL